MNNSESIYEYAELLRKKLYQPTEKKEEFTKFYKKTISLKKKNLNYNLSLENLQKKKKKKKI